MAGCWFIITLITLLLLLFLLSNTFSTCDGSFYVSNLIGLKVAQRAGKTFPGVSVGVSLEEISLWVCRLVKITLTSTGGYHSILRAWMEQKGGQRASSFSLRWHVCPLLPPGIGVSGLAPWDSEWDIHHQSSALRPLNLDWKNNNNKKSISISISISPIGSVSLENPV